MKKIIKIIALATVLAFTAEGCTKEETIENVRSMAEQQTATYIVDGKRHSANPRNEDEWAAFYDQMIALAKEGHEVRFWRNDVVRVSVASKEQVTHSTTNEQDAKEWCEQMNKAGYETIIIYDDLPLYRNQIIVTTSGRDYTAALKQ